MKSKRSKAYWDMSLDELREATKEFDAPTNLSKTRPLSKKERAEWNRARKGPTYSIRVYDGKKKSLTIRLDEDLIAWSESYAKRHNMTRDDVIARSLRSIQTFAGQ